jgi:hypothetical protein
LPVHGYPQEKPAQTGRVRREEKSVQKTLVNYKNGGGEGVFGAKNAQKGLSQQTQPFQSSSIAKFMDSRKTTERHSCFSPVAHDKATTFNILFSAFPRDEKT